MKSEVNAAGMRWYARVGDKIRIPNHGREGVVVNVHQTGNAPAVLTVALAPTADRPREFEELLQDDIERDTSDDPEFPSFQDCAKEMTLEVAGRVVLRSIIELAAFRAACDREDTLVSVIEAEAYRARRLSRAYSESHRYDLAQLEAVRFQHLRELSVAVDAIVKSGSFVG